MPSRIGLTELVLLSVMLVVFFGSRKVPDFIKGAAEGIKEFKKASGETE